MPSAWVAHVKKYYSDRKKKEPDYKYKNAMKDARASYKKVGAKVEKEEEKKPKIRRRRRKKIVVEEEKEKPKPKRRKKRVPKNFTKVD